MNSQIIKFSISKTAICLHRGPIQILKRYVQHDAGNLLYILLRRGLVKQIFPSEQEIKSSGPSCAYAGFDATSDSLHVGNLLVLVALLHWQRAGHDPIVVIGDTTALIGDPSGHDSERKVLSSEIVKQNADFIEKSVHQIFENHEKYILPKSKKKHKLGKLRVFRNSEWYNNLSLVEFFSRAGRNIRIGDMLSRTSVKLRMESGAGMNLSEFSYQAFQSYDWLHLFENYNCRLQFGGNDQLGNITSGYTLISGYCNEAVHGAALPLIQSESGDKFGKSSGNALYLSSHKTSQFDLYQFFMRLPDTDVCNYLPLFSFLGQDENEEFVQRHMRSPDSRKGQKKIAEDVTLLVHGERGLHVAEAATKILYKSDLSALSSLESDELSQVFPPSTISNIVYEPGMKLLELTMKMRCFLTEDDAHRIIREGGVYLNFQRITSPQYVIVPDQHVLPNRTSLIRIGKKTYYVVVWE